MTVVRTARGGGGGANWGGGGGVKGVAPVPGVLGADVTATECEIRVRSIKRGGHYWLIDGKF